MHTRADMPLELECVLRDITVARDGLMVLGLCLVMMIFVMMLIFAIGQKGYSSNSD
jgi:hypothetical protein